MIVYKIVQDSQVMATSDTPITVENGHYRSASKVWLSYGPENAQVVVENIEDAPQTPERHITRLAFRQRFTAAEKAALTFAARQNTPEGAAVQAYLDDVQAATFIDLDRPDTRAGVLALESAGLLAAGRATEILGAPIQDQERPQ